MTGVKNTLVLIILAFLPKILHCVEYYVKPEYSFTACPSQPCLTLSEYLQDPTTYFTSGSTFTLLQGQHLLNQTMALSDVTGITLRGAGERIVISINKGGSITWNNCTDIEISSLEILYAGRDETPHAAMIVEECEVEISDMKFSGGGIYSQGIRLSHSSAIFSNCSFMKWYSNDGGAVVHSNASNVTFSGYTNFTNNRAGRFGGGFYANSSNITFMGNTMFLMNFGRGAGLYSYRSIIQFNGLSIFKRNNFSGGLSLGHALYIDETALRILNKIVFSENVGFALYGLDSNTTMEGETMFSKNTGCVLLHSSSFSCVGNIYFCNNTLTEEDTDNYAGVSVLDSVVVFNGRAVFVNNTGAFHAYISHIQFLGEVFFKNNSANHDSYNGGGISILQSTLKCNGTITFAGNFALRKGGAVYALNSIIIISGISRFVNNTAMKGGGMVLEEDLYASRSPKLVLQSPVKMSFENNIAVLNGGALFIYDSNINTQCTKYTYGSCFFAIESNYSSISGVHFKFVQNKAEAGAVLYGSSLGSCYVEMNGHYIGNSLQLFYNLSNINSEIDYIIGSNSVQVDFCNSDFCTDIDDCTIVYAERGKNFTLSVQALGQGGIPVASTINAFMKNDYSNYQSELTPQSQNIKNSCTNITFRLNARTSQNTLVLHPDGPCSYRQREITVILAPCPPGFYLNDIYCTCDERLLTIAHNIVLCDQEDLVIQRLGNSWILPVWSENNTYMGFTYHSHCPLKYCKPSYKKIYLTFSSSDSDALCSLNRTGLLCGACKKGFSQIFNSFSCQKCSNKFISLLLFFGFAGIALIAMLLALHMTVAAGTINGLILYANIVNVNSAIFFPSNNTNKLTVFISWLNFDFGIETCFSNGLDFYSYAWLQYAFPFYLWFLIVAIILSSKVSAKVGKLFGSNPVAVLATVLLMSFTKLLQAIRLTLVSTTLEYSNGSRKKVWMYDGNITFFEGKHGILVLLSLCVILLFLIYCFLVLFGYCLQAYSGRRGFLWFNKFTPLLDAYYAPYHPKMRFWPGFMILVRACFFIIINSITSDRVNLITISCVFIAIALIPWLGCHVYKTRCNNILEASFILNLCLLSMVTYHVKPVGRSQEIVTNLSISVVLIQFVGIIFFHICLRLKNTKLAKLVIRRSPKKTLPNSEESNNKQASAQGITSTVIELREPLLDSAKVD